MELSKKKLIIGVAISCLLFVTLTLLIFTGSLPQTYPLKVNDASPYEIVAPRSIIDRKKTEERAQEAMASVAKKMIKNEEVSAASIARVETLISLIRERRDRLYSPADKPNPGNQTTPTETTAGPVTNTDPNRLTQVKQPSADDIATAATSMVSQINQSLSIDFDLAAARRMLEISQDQFEFVAANLKDAAVLIMQNAFDQNQLPDLIKTTLDKQEETQEYYLKDREQMQDILAQLLKPNIEYDAVATQNSRQDAYNRVMNNPIMINRGYRLVSPGDIITQEIYDILVELDLTESDSLDWMSLFGHIILVILLMLAVAVYLFAHERDILRENRALLSLFLTLMIPLLVARYTTHVYPLSAPVYFATVLICAYFGLRTAMVLTMALCVAILPMTSFNPYFIPIALVGSLAAAIFTRSISRQDNYAKLILATALTNFGVVLAISMIQHDSWQVTMINASSVVISGVVSVIAAIGVMPVFEIIFNTVSPLRLIELSQPGHPLMKRLFVEAPGSSQHSMMVANLADAAAEAIGANAMIVRVGAYFHDIGKLENPVMYTENQTGDNPHDRLTPEESTAIITRHPEDGVKLGKRYHLPNPVLKMIHEHHGTTVLQFFYHKACEQAERENLPEPNINQFRYNCPLPSSRESAILMLADSVEAAMKSSGFDNLSEAKKLMRNIVKIKNDQNQLVNSGLSFHDVELIIQAFLQVYAGHFHERIKYPESR